MPPPGYPSSEYSPALFPTSAAGGDPKAAGESGEKPRKTWGDAALWAVTGLAVVLLIGLIAVVVLLVTELDDQREKGKVWLLERILKIFVAQNKKNNTMQLIKFLKPIHQIHQIL